jgi:hypothetical protein
LKQVSSSIPSLSSSPKSLNRRSLLLLLEAKLAPLSGRSTSREARASCARLFHTDCSRGSAAAEGLAVMRR